MWDGPGHDELEDDYYFKLGIETPQEVLDEEQQEAEEDGLA